MIFIVVAIIIIVVLFILVKGKKVQIQLKFADEVLRMSACLAILQNKDSMDALRFLRRISLDSNDITHIFSRTNFDKSDIAFCWLQYYLLHKLFEDEKKIYIHLGEEYCLSKDDATEFLEQIKSSTSLRKVDVDQLFDVWMEEVKCQDIGTELFRVVDRSLTYCDLEKKLDQNVTLVNQIEQIRSGVLGVMLAHLHPSSKVMIGAMAIANNKN